MTKITGHWLYAFIIIFIIMPINGKIIFMQKQYIFGIFLCVLQISWFVQNVLERNKEKKK